MQLRSGKVLNVSLTRTKKRKFETITSKAIEKNKAADAENKRIARENEEKMKTFYTQMRKRLELFFSIKNDISKLLTELEITNSIVAGSFPLSVVCDQKQSCQFVPNDLDIWVSHECNTDEFVRILLANGFKRVNSEEINDIVKIYVGDVESYKLGTKSVQIVKLTLNTDSIGATDVVHAISAPCDATSVARASDYNEVFKHISSTFDIDACKLCWMVDIEKLKLKLPSNTTRLITTLQTNITNFEFGISGWIRYQKYSRRGFQLKTTCELLQNPDRIHCSAKFGELQYKINKNFSSDNIKYTLGHVRDTISSRDSDVVGVDDVSDKKNDTHTTSLVYIGDTLLSFEKTPAWNTTQCKEEYCYYADNKKKHLHINITGTKKLVHLTCSDSVECKSQLFEEASAATRYIYDYLGIADAAKAMFSGYFSLEGKHLYTLLQQQLRIMIPQETKLLLDNSSMFVCGSTPVSAICGEQFGPSGQLMASSQMDDPSSRQMNQLSDLDIACLNKKTWDDVPCLTNATQYGLNQVLLKSNKSLDKKVASQLDFMFFTNKITNLTSAYVCAVLELQDMILKNFDVKVCSLMCSISKDSIMTDQWLCYFYDFCYASVYKQSDFQVNVFMSSDTNICSYPSQKRFQKYKTRQFSLNITNPTRVPHNLFPYVKVVSTMGTDYSPDEYECFEGDACIYNSDIYPPLSRYPEMVCKITSFGTKKYISLRANQNFADQIDYDPRRDMCLYCQTQCPKHLHMIDGCHMVPLFLKSDNKKKHCLMVDEATIKANIPYDEPLWEEFAGTSKTNPRDSYYDYVHGDKLQRGWGKVFVKYAQKFKKLIKPLYAMATKSIDPKTIQDPHVRLIVEYGHMFLEPHVNLQILENVAMNLDVGPAIAMSSSSSSSTSHVHDVDFYDIWAHSKNNTWLTTPKSQDCSIQQFNNLMEHIILLRNH